MNMYTNTQNIAYGIREVLDHLGLPVDSSDSCGLDQAI